MNLKHQKILPAAAFSLVLFHYVAEAQQTMVGWLEKVGLGSNGFSVEAKIDTGADNSSVNALKPQVYLKQDTEWVVFSLKNKEGQEIQIDKPIEHRTRIKMKNGDSQERIVIKMDVCLAGINKQVHVNLVDRSHFKYQVLIGRSYLSPEFLVDPGKTFIVEPRCQAGD